MRVPTQLRTWTPRLFGAALLTWAVIILWREVRGLDAGEVLAHMRAWGAWRIALAVVLAAASFVLVAVVEWLGLRWSGAPMPWRTAALRSFIVNGLIHSLGANVVTATLTRSWVYRRTGLRLIASAATTAFAAITLFVGLAVLVGVSLLIAPPEQLRILHLGELAGRVGGALLLGLVAAYVAACAAWPSARLFAGVRLPGPGYAVAQVVIGTVDNLVSTTLLWLLVGQPAPPFAPFVVSYVLAYLAGLFSHVPGGAGVFEASLFLLLPRASRASLAAGFLGFRLIFYLLPLMAALALVLAEIARAPPSTRRRRPSARGGAA